MAGTLIENRTSEREKERERSRAGELTRRTEEYSHGPFSMMRRLSEEMDRAFGNAFGGWMGRGEHGVWSPAVEVRERDGNIEVTAELPGMKKDDVKVECTDDGIVIEGERRHEHEENEKGYHRSERSYGHFYRLIPLPTGADPERAKAEFKDGLLQVRVPIQENKRRKSIPISA
jgi:HSP20 family protein